MILREYRRLVRRSLLGTLLPAILLAVGFAGSSVTYTIMQTMLAPRPSGFRPMAYATIAEEAGGGGSQPISWKSYERLRGAGDSSDITLVAYAEPIQVHLSYGQSERDVAVAAASNGFLGTYTAGLKGGGDFSSSWQGRHGGTEVILSASLAERLFTDATEGPGRNILLNNQSFRVVGIAPKSLSGLWSSTDAWVTPDKTASLTFGAFAAKLKRAGEHSPFLDNPEVWQKPHLFYVFAGSSTSSLKALHERLEKWVHLPENAQNHLHVSDGLTKDPGWDSKIRSWARLAFLLSTALIFAAALNYCGLLLAQGPRYMEEVRLKQVLGAGVLRLVLESMCGPVITVLAGFVLAASGTVAVLWMLGRQQPRFLPTGGISWETALGILGMGLGIACVLAILIAFVPALRLLRDSGTPHMGYTTTPSRKANFVLYGIVSGQIASCIVVCLVAAMIVGAVRSLSRETLGFNSDQLAVLATGPATRGAHVAFSTSDVGDFPLATFTRQVVADSPGAVYGVKSASAASCAPLAQPLKTISVQPMDRSLPPRSVHFCAVSQGFFQTMGNPIVEGRGFSSDSFTGDVVEVMINRQLADGLWPGQNPLHRTVRIEEPAWGIQFVAEVVGVAQDMRLSGLTSTPDATVFLPLRGNVFTLSFPLYFLIKGTASLRSVEGFTRQQAEGSAPSLGVNTSYRVDERLRESFMEQNVRVWFSAGGAALVAVIAYLGLYGVLVHSVNSKRKEMALRSCFGASASSLRTIIIRQALQCSAAAVAISLLAWRPVMLLASRAWVGKMELSWQLAVAIPLMCFTAAVGISLMPASAAAKVSPGEILKEQ